MLKILIVDDEPLARRGVRVCLRKVPDADVIGECSSGQEALQQIRELRPDLVFLDIQMPGMTGLDVAAQLDDSVIPLIVFVTAYDEFALKAFAVHAVDYVLKPIHDGRFMEVLNVVRQRIHDKRAGEMMTNIRRLLGDREQAPGKPAYIDKIVVKTGNRSLYLPVSDIEWVEASGDYISIHVGPRTHLIRETMDGLERQMDPAQFVRIHRSTIVARRHIQQLRSLPTRDASVLLVDGTVLRASRRYRSRI
jgi:two-component system, LytTR family, response regulator